MAIDRGPRAIICEAFDVTMQTIMVKFCSYSPIYCCLPDFMVPWNQYQGHFAIFNFVVNHFVTYEIISVANV